MRSVASGAGGPPDVARLCQRLARRFRSWASVAEPEWPAGDFEELALETFRVQFEHVQPYRAYCRRRGVVPGEVQDWTAVPAVPTAAFRAVDLIAGDPRSARLVFRTSGTTRGTDRRGRHLILEPELYRASLEAAFRRFVVPDLPAPRMIALHPPFEVGEDSSLAWMIDAVLARFGDPGSIHAVTTGELEWRRAAEAAARAAAEGRPVCLLATTLGFDAWMEWLERHAIRVSLPDGSRAMDTGGSKGRPDLSRPSVVERMGDRLGLDPSGVINEFGMTELCSQRYAIPGASGSGPTRFAGPPWLRTRALDPVTLAPLPEGEEGVLCHFDLANAGSVSHVLTEDLGRVRGGIVEWVGRVPGARPRGCSLATAELLAAQPDG
ncbi:MAG: hypothetical protein ACE5HF_02760 [Gemmatimonadota bacterium]